MDSTPKISVIIPVYNVEPYLRQCLNSVVNQTYRNLEIIIIDDGSPDNCGKICDEYAQKDDRITVIHKENRGLSAGWNDGIAASSGEWIAFVDSDDWVDSTYFEKIIDGVMNLDKPDIIVAGQYYEERNGAAVERVSFLKPFLAEGKKVGECLQLKVLVAVDKKQPYDRMTCVWNKLYNASFIKKEGLSFDIELRAGLGNDVLFNYLAFGKARMVCGVGYAGYHYRVLSTAGTRKFDLNRPNAVHFMLERIHQGIKSNNSSPLVWEAFEAFSLQQIINNLLLYYFHDANKEEYPRVEKEIKQMMKMPRYQMAIYSKSSKFLTPKQKIIKHVLQLKQIWLVKLFVTVKKGMTK